ncbi:MAG TPA: choice-of-anchor tandem repeat GloVer-containing protein, partial [Candidatus Tumulicola sp.]
MNGNLYGTTSQGGAVDANGNGTIYRLDTAGKEKVLHSFAGSPDGQFPQAGLTAVKGVLYGTTPNGG